MKWKKLGRIFSAEKRYGDWCVSHAACPFPEHMGNGVFRIYFSCRDEQNRSTIVYVDFDLEQMKCVTETPVPVIFPGELGLYDDCGCLMGSVITTPAGEKRLYYQGWHLTRPAPQMNMIGMARYNTNQGIFEKYSRVPVLDRTDECPFSVSMPIVMYDEGRYRMWFGSIKSWVGNRPLDIWLRTAESKDGIHWRVLPDIVMDRGNEEEYSFAVSTVIKEAGIYKMFYSYRGKAYRIGYAESEDGYIWKRMDEQMEINASERGWDSEMIEFPSIFDYKGKRYMLYCGNGYGKTGFGVAVLEE